MNEQFKKLPPAAQLPDYTNLTAHPLAELVPMMNDDDFAQHKADVAKYGVREQITLYQGAVLDGRNRLKAAKELKLTLMPANFKEFIGTLAEAEAFVISSNSRRNLSNKQKQEFAQTMIRRYPDESDRALGRRTGLSKNTIAAARVALPTTQRAESSTLL